MTQSYVIILFISKSSGNSEWNQSDACLLITLFSLRPSGRTTNGAVLLVPVHKYSGLKHLGFSCSSMCSAICSWQKVFLITSVTLVSYMIHLGAWCQVGSRWKAAPQWSRFPSLWPRVASQLLTPCTSSPRRIKYGSNPRWRDFRIITTYSENCVSKRTF